MFQWLFQLLALFPGFPTASAEDDGDKGPTIDPDG
jgi:hypothetical protein